MKTQVKEILKQVKENGSATLSLSKGNEAGIKALILSLNEAGLEAEIVTIGGNSQGLYVSPKWDSLLDLEALESIEEVSPISSQGTRTLSPKNSSSIKSIEWHDDNSMIVIYTSSSTPYSYIDVPESKFLQLVEIDNMGGSVGSFVARQIKPFHSASKVA